MTINTTTNIDTQIPLMNNVFPKAKRDYPISERENLMLALDCRKPLWMPNFEGGSRIACDGPGYITGFSYDGEIRKNIWGIEFRYSAAQLSATPQTPVLSDVTKWETELVFPKIAEIGLEKQAEGFVRDENLALCTHVDSACFEQFHMLEGFEQALVDLITEPAACRSLFEALVDFQLEVFKTQNELFGFDYILYHDDWGTARGPFFSVDLFRETILPPTIRLVKTIQDQGVKVFFHNCGLIDDFVPFLVDDIHAAGLQIQDVNDIGHIIRTYGDRITTEYRRPGQHVLFAPDATAGRVRELARQVVDAFGAHVNPGAGAVCTISAPSEEIYNVFDEEMFLYSLEKYRGL